MFKRGLVSIVVLLLALWLGQYYYTVTVVMPTLAAVTAANNQINLAGKQSLVVGGTSGIGQAIAYRLASLHSNVCIVGRNEKVGNDMVKELKEKYPEASFDFIKADLFLMKEIRRTAKQFMETHDRLDHLVLTQGIFTTQGRTETPEGIDQKLALHYYGRHLMIRETIPLLEKTASADNNNVSVLTVLAATQGRPVGDDLDLKNSYSIKRAADSATFHSDLMVDEFSRRHPSIGFLHSYPGVVNTPLLHKNYQLLKWLATPFTVTPEQCAEYMTYALLDEKNQKGFKLISNHGDPLNPTRYHNDEIRKKVWDHTVELTAEENLKQ